MVRLLGRRVEFDKASRDYPIRKLLGKTRKPRSYTWSCNTWLDQGREGACVGYAFAHELIARPVAINKINVGDAYNIYKTAQTLDKWPGENYDGTSILGGVKAVQKIFPTAIVEYRWAFGLNDVLDTLGYFGPICLGLNWYNGMFDTDDRGYIHRKGGIAGGHAILAVGVDHKRQRVRLHNSWGKSWGMGGDCYISFGDLDKLLKERGEACVPVKRGKI